MQSYGPDFRCISSEVIFPSLRVPTSTFPRRTTRGANGLGEPLRQRNEVRLTIRKFSAGVGERRKFSVCLMRNVGRVVIPPGARLAVL